MNKIKDCISLSMLAGGIGAVLGITLDKILVWLNLSKRSWLTTAAGVWVGKRRDAKSSTGQLLGLFMSIGLSMIGAVGFLNVLTKYGRDKIILKGLFFGMTFSSTIHALLSGIGNSKLKPTNSASNLSYLLSGSLYGVSTAIALAKLGHDSLFDAQQQNNQLKPTEKTSEEVTDTPVLCLTR